MYTTSSRSNMITQNEQKLVDICFSVGLMIQNNRHRKYFDNLGTEGTAEWIAKQLRDCGFETTPVGSSWGSLDKVPG